MLSCFHLLQHSFQGRRRIAILASLVFGLLAVLSPGASAQQLTGSLSGIAYDSSGAVIPSATVTLKNAASGDVRKVTTDSKGFFSISAVQPATYSITVSANGFKSWQENSVVMNEGDDREVANIRLGVGGNSTDVTVVANNDVTVPLDNGEISTTINEQMVQDITLQGRDAGELVTLMPGMAMNGGVGNRSTFNDTTVGSNNGPVGSYSSNGTQPNGAMAFLLDGANLVDPGNAGTQVANINQDMVSEVKVLQSDYNAEYAKGPTIFEAFSKSGGNRYHGEAYIYVKNSALNSFESYAKSQYVSDVASGTLTPALSTSLNPASHYWYLGGNVGGPVKLPFIKWNRDNKKLFFWVGYEYMDQHPASTPVNYNVPTAGQLAGDFTNTGVPQGAINAWGGAYNYLNPNSATGTAPSDVPGATNVPCPNNASAMCVTHVPMADFDSNSQSLLKANIYPAANLTPSAGNGWNNYQYGNSTPQNRYEITGKLDYALNDNTKVTASYARQIEKDQHPISIWWAAPWTLPYPGGVVAATTSQVFLANVTHSFSSSTTNEFVYGLARYINPSIPANEAASDRTKVGFDVTGLFNHTSKQIPNIEGPWGGSFANVSNFSFDGTFNGGSFGGLKKSPQIYDNFTKIIGTHAVKAGVYWDTEENIQSSGAADNGTYNYGYSGISTNNWYADFLLARPGNYQQASAIPVDDIKMHQYSFYVQDSWRANKQLTLNYGVRFDHVGQWYGTPSGFQVFDPTAYGNGTGTDPGLTWHAKNSAVPESGFTSPKFALEPRVSFAYDINGDGKTVFRGGIALFRYQTSVNDVTADNAADGPAGTFTYTTCKTILGGYQGITGSNQCTPSGGGAENGGTIGFEAWHDNKTPTTMDWNLTVSRALPWRSVAEFSYVANRSRNEFINGGNGHYDDLNAIQPGAFFHPDPITGATLSPTGSGFNGNDYRPYQAYQDMYLLTHGSFANYNSLQVSWQKQSGPVNFLTNYTFSKVLGIWDGDSSNGGGNGTMIDPFNLKNNYGPLAYDHTSILNLVYIWKLPSITHNRLLAGGVNGWEFSGTTQYQSGAPLQPNFGGTMNANYYLNGNDFLGEPNGTKATYISTSTWFGSSTLNVIAPNVICDPRSGRAKGAYFNPKCLAPPTQGQQGTLEEPYTHAPAYFNSNLALYKKFTITENQNVQLRISAVNFLNHPLSQFGLAGNADENVNYYLNTNVVGQYSGSYTQTGTNGKPAFTTGQRILEIAAKYYF